MPCIGRLRVSLSVVVTTWRCMAVGGQLPGSCPPHSVLNAVRCDLTLIVTQQMAALRVKAGLGAGGAGEADGLPTSPGSWTALACGPGWHAGTPAAEMFLPMHRT